MRWPFFSFFLTRLLYPSRAMISPCSPASECGERGGRPYDISINLPGANRHHHSFVACAGCVLLAAGQTSYFAKLKFQIGKFHLNEMIKLAILRRYLIVPVCAAYYHSPVCRATKELVCRTQRKTPIVGVLFCFGNSQQISIGKNFVPKRGCSKARPSLPLPLVRVMYLFINFQSIGNLT